MKNIFLRIVCLVFVLTSVNCIETGSNKPKTPVTMTPVETVSIPNITELMGSGVDNPVDGGNGTQYDGKIPPGKYVRTLIDQICGPDIKNLGEIIVDEKQVKGRLVDPETCQTTDVDMETRDLDHSQYHRGRVGRFEGIYSKEEAQPSVPGFDEVWCRKEGSTSTIGFDIVIKADYAANKFTTIAASAIANADGVIVETKYKPIAVIKKREEYERIRYNGDGIDLVIKRRDYNEKTGLMTGDLEFEKNGIKEEMFIECRLGADLDVLLPKNEEVSP